MGEGCGPRLESALRGPLHQRNPTHRLCHIPDVKPLLKQRPRHKRLTWAGEIKNWIVAQRSKVLFSDESQFCISFGNQGPRVWRKSGKASTLMLTGLKVIHHKSVPGFQNSRKANFYGFNSIFSIHKRWKRAARIKELFMMFVVIYLCILFTHRRKLKKWKVSFSWILTYIQC